VGALCHRPSIYGGLTGGPARGGIRHHEAPARTGPDVAELQESTSWFWLWCERCQHSAPIKFAPLIARWGADASSDKLRRGARCTKCGHKGATLQHPGWVDSAGGFQPFSEADVR